MDVSVELHCDRCGSAHLTFPAEGEDDGAIGCNDCGAPLGTMAALKAELEACARAHSAEQLRRDLDKIP